MVYSEHPGYTAFVDHRKADTLGIPQADNLPDGIYSAPLDVHISLTNRCNLKCPGCYAYDEDHPDTDMTFETATAVLDHLARMNVFTVAFGGGEPLLHPRVFDIARYAREREIAPNVTTNGLPVDRAVAKECRVFGSLHVSCHSADELERLTETVALLKEQNISPGLNLLVSSATFEHVPQICSWCAGVGINRVLFLKFKLTESNRPHADMALDSSQEKALLPAVKKLARKHGFMPLLDCSFFPILVHHSVKKRDLEFFDVNGCLGGNAYLAVTTDGSYKPCSFWPTAIGKLETLDRETWVREEQLASFRAARQLPRCESCDYLDLCNGGCRVCDRQGCEG